MRSKLYSSKRLPALLVAALALAAAGCSSPSLRSVAPDDRKPAPDFKLKDATGRDVTLTALKGKVVLLNFWATSCGPCRTEIPWLIEFERTYKHKGFAVVGIALDDGGWDVVKPYINGMQVNYRVVLGTHPVARDYGGIYAIPTTFMIDKEGRVASKHVGLLRKADFEYEIETLLE